jgi:hypothetical protein
LVGGFFYYLFNKFLFGFQIPLSYFFFLLFNNKKKIFYFFFFFFFFLHAVDLLSPILWHCHTH